MKKIFGLALFSLLLLTVGTTLLKPPAVTTQSRVYIPQADLAFAVLGDVHSNTGSLQMAIKDLYRIDPKLDALVLNGDTVDQGLTSQYAAVKKTLAENKAFLPPVIIKNIGNHEFFDYQIKINSPEDVRAFIRRYLEFAGTDRVYHDIWIKGYHFISLGSEDGNSRTLDSVRAYISPDQQNWLQAKLAEKYNKDRPIFVFIHQPLNTNSSSGWIGSDQGKQISELLSRYPEVILFTSHTHRNLDETSVNTEQAFTTVHTGAVHYTILPDGQGGRKLEPFVKGVYVRVKGIQVVISGRDMKAHTWIFTKKIVK
jgi:Icc protein